MYFWKWQQWHIHQFVDFCNFSGIKSENCIPFDSTVILNYFHPSIPPFSAKGIPRSSLQHVLGHCAGVVALL